MTSKSQTNSTDEKGMTCQELESFIVDYLDDRLPSEQRTIFNHHLQDCPDCTNYLANYSNAVRLGQKAFADIDETNCEQIPENLVQAILSTNKKDD